MRATHQKTLSASILSICLFLTGCFTVGKLPMQISGGPSLEAPHKAILVPGSGDIVNVDGKIPDFSTGDALANLGLNLLLMKLEPQLPLHPGKHVVLVKTGTSTSFSTGYYTVTTNYWRHIPLPVELVAGKKYKVNGEYYSQRVWLEEMKG